MSTTDLSPSGLSSSSSPQKHRKPLTVQKILAMQDEIAAIDKKIASLQRRTQSMSGPLFSGTPPHATCSPNVGNDPSLLPAMAASPTTIGASHSFAPYAQQESFDDDDEPLSKLMASEMCQLAAAGDVAALTALLSTESVIVDCRDYDGRTPLHLAVMHGRKDVAELLIQHGASRSAEDEEGRTPADYAKDCGDDALHDLLVFVPTIDPSTAEPDSFLRTNSPTTFEESAARSVTSSSAGGGASTSTMHQHEADMVIVMVGLPGRGKSYVAQQIRRYFTWNHSSCQIITHQSYRKRATGTTTSYPPNMPDAEYRTGSLIAKEVKEWFLQHGGGSVAIVDGTHSTAARRKTLHACLRDIKAAPSSRLLFVEVFNSDPQLIRTNVMRAMEQQSNPSPTFVEDYYRNMHEHEAVYKPLSSATDPDLRFIRVVDQSTFYLHRIDGWGPSRLAYMLHNLRHTPVDLFLTRSGEYEDLVNGRIGGNSRLSIRGEAYSQALFDYMKETTEGNPFVVMSSCALRCKQTVQHFVASATAQVTPGHSSRRLQDVDWSHRASQDSNLSEGVTTPAATSANSLSPQCRVGYFPTLDDLNHGDCEGQLLSEIWKTLPNTMSSMQQDPYHVAWPNGESIHQLFAGRLEPHIHEIQASREPLLIVSHDPLIQGFYAYFVPKPDGGLYSPEEAHHVKIAMHTVIRIRQHYDTRVAEFIDLTDRVNALLSTNPLSGHGPSGRSPVASMQPRGSTVW